MLKLQSLVQELALARDEQELRLPFMDAEKASYLQLNIGEFRFAIKRGSWMSISKVYPTALLTTTPVLELQSIHSENMWLSIMRQFMSKCYSRQKVGSAAPYMFTVAVFNIITSMP